MKPPNPMNSCMTPETNNGNRRPFWRRLLLVLGVQLFGLICIGAAIELRRATQSEVNNGSRVNAYVAPYELNHWTGGGGGPTNGQTAAQVQAAITSADASGTNLMKPSSLVLGQITISTNASTGMIMWSNTTTHVALVTLGTNGVLAIYGVGITNNSDMSGGTNSMASKKEAAAIATALLGGSGFPLASDVSAANHALVGMSDIGGTNSGTQSEAHWTVGATLAGGYVIWQAGAKTNSTDSNVQLAAQRFSGAFVGDGSSITNLTNANIVVAGNNITITASTNGPTGKITFTAALADPINLSQANIGTTWLTNMVFPTNTLGGTALDFAISEATSNIVGTVSFSSVANLTAGAVNRCVRTLINKTGSDQTLSLATGWNQGIYDTYTMTNNTVTEVFAKVQPGVYTNVYVKLTKPH
jgi:hypothetical protein